MLPRMYSVLNFTMDSSSVWLTLPKSLQQHEQYAAPPIHVSHLPFAYTCSLRVLQVHKTTLHRDGGLEELTFFPRYAGVCGLHAAELPQFRSHFPCDAIQSHSKGIPG